MAINVPEDYFIPNIDPIECFDPSTLGVILSNNCYSKMMELLQASIDNELEERGTFFFGKKVGDYIIFDMYLSDFVVEKDYLKNGFAKYSSTNQNEVAKYTNKKVMLGEQYRYILDFKVRSKSHKDVEGVFCNPDNIDKFSQHDLYEYRWLDKYLQPLCGDNVTFLGGILTTQDETKPCISIIRYNKETKEFTNIEDIRFNDNNNLYRLNNKNIYDNKLLESSEQQKVIYSVKIYNEDRDKKILL